MCSENNEKTGRKIKNLTDLKAGLWLANQHLNLRSLDLLLPVFICDYILIADFSPNPLELTLCSEIDMKSLKKQNGYVKQLFFQFYFFYLK